jgi:hypothetical protein
MEKMRKEAKAGDAAKDSDEESVAELDSDSDTDLEDDDAADVWVDEDADEIEEEPEPEPSVPAKASTIKPKKTGKGGKTSKVFTPVDKVRTSFRHSRNVQLFLDSRFSGSHITLRDTAQESSATHPQKVRQEVSAFGLCSKHGHSMEYPVR